MTVAVSAIDLRSRFENYCAQERERNDLIDVGLDLMSEVPRIEVPTKECS